MKTYLTRKEHEAAGDYSWPVKIRGHLYRVSAPPVFEDDRDTANVEAVLIGPAPSELPGSKD